MRKILLILATITLMTVGVNAQVMEIYNGNTLIKTYTQEQADRVVLEEAPAIINVTSITVTGSMTEINVGESLQLSATVSPSNATNKSVTWSSSNTSVATVSSSGLVKAVKAGSVTITATAQDGSGVKGTYMIMVSSASNTHNGHEYVDLGLSVKWANMNIGATSMEDYGDYFAWGETVGYNGGKKTFSESTYKYYMSTTTSGYTKYVTKSDASNYGYDGFYDNKTILDPEDDAAVANWGGSWRMPTEAEQDELRTKCTWEWKELNGKEGYKVTGPNGNFIFLPAAGYRDFSSLNNVGFRGCGYFWSSSLYSYYSNCAYYLYFHSGHVDWNFDIRYYGLSVRAVCP